MNKHKLDPKKLREKTWKKLPLREDIKNLAIGWSIFDEKDKTLLDLKEGYYMVLSPVEGSKFDKIKEGLILLIMDENKKIHSLALA